MAVLFTLNGTVEQGLLLKDALCFLYKYQPQIQNPDNPDEMIDNPESDIHFAKHQPSLKTS